jgi:hypothetical protein
MRIAAFMVVLLAFPMLLALDGASQNSAPPDPFVFLRPSIIVTANERRQLDRGEPLARVLPARDHEVAIFAAVGVAADGDRLVAWMRQIEDLKKSAFVRQIGRFSDPPRIEDLASLSLDDEDLTEIRKCRRRDCALKLAAAEMEELRRAADESGAEWKPALQDAFRRLVLRRVEAFLQGGHAALPAYEDNDAPVLLGGRFSLLVRHSGFLTKNHPQFSEYLERYPRAPLPDLESFVYWSKEGVGAKAIVSATQVNILRGTDGFVPDALVIGKEIFSTHYVNASLSLTAVVGEPGAHNYLVYFNRTEVDVLGRIFGGLVRVFMERRLRAEASDVLRGLRTRLESGEPKI